MAVLVGGPGLEGGVLPKFSRVGVKRSETRRCKWTRQSNLGHVEAKLSSAVKTESSSSLDILLFKYWKLG